MPVYEPYLAKNQKLKSEIRGLAILPAMLPFPHALPHGARDYRSCSTHRRRALPDAANIEVMKVKAAKYLNKFDYCHGRAWTKTLLMRDSHYSCAPGGSDGQEPSGNPAGHARTDQTEREGGAWRA
jgi:hypothetical protein